MDEPNGARTSRDNMLQKRSVAVSFNVCVEKIGWVALAVAFLDVAASEVRMVSAEGARHVALCVCFFIFCPSFLIRCHPPPLWLRFQPEKPQCRCCAETFRWMSRETRTHTEPWVQRSRWCHPCFTARHNARDVGCSAAHWYSDRRLELVQSHSVEGHRMLRLASVSRKYLGKC